jgi:Tfp pilus assembly protein PilN
MPNINLIAERREDKRRMERLSKQLFYAMGTSLAIFVGVASYLLTERVKLAGDVAEADRRMEDLQGKLTLIENIRKEIADKKPKVETLERARYDTLRWTLLFQSIAQALPRDVWLNSMGATDSEPPVINLSGSAPSQETAGQITLNLKNQAIFSHVDLLSTNRTDKNRFGFQITAPIKPVVLPTQAPPSEEKKTAQSEPTGKGGTDRV